MLVYINGRFLLQRQTGVNRFAYEISKALVRSGKHRVVIICPKGDILNDYDVSMFDVVQWGCGRSHFWEQCILPFYVLFHKGLLVNLTGLAPILIKNKIMTIHDLAFYENNNWYAKYYVWYYRLMTPICARTSKYILTVSEFSKKQISLLLKQPSDKICVLYNAVADKFQQSQDEESQLPEKYILAVSTIDPRKNLIRLMEAFVKMENKQGVQLYLIGGLNPVFTKMNMTNDPSIKWLGRVSDGELVKYYRNAVCFVYPSLYEGFGIPPLEAMASKVPVIVSDIPPLREVCGDAAIYVDPYDMQSIQNAMSIVTTDSELRNKMIQKGAEQYKLFDWIESAEKLNDLLTSLS